MVKSIVVLLGVACALTMATGEAAATKRCAPLPIGSSVSTCKCSVQNFSTVADTGVKIEVYAANGGFTTCGPETVPARTALSCPVSIAANTTCGCVVSGEGALTLASLSVMDPSNAGPQTSLECQ